MMPVAEVLEVERGSTRTRFNAYDPHTSGAHLVLVHYMLESEGPRRVGQLRPNSQSKVARRGEVLLVDRQRRACTKKSLTQRMHYDHKQKYECSAPHVDILAYVQSSKNVPPA